MRNTRPLQGGGGGHHPQPCISTRERGGEAGGGGTGEKGLHRGGTFTRGEEGLHGGKGDEGNTGPPLLGEALHRGEHGLSPTALLCLPGRRRCGEEEQRGRLRGKGRRGGKGRGSVGREREGMAVSFLPLGRGGDLEGLGWLLPSCLWGGTGTWKGWLFGAEMTRPARSWIHSSRSVTSPCEAATSHRSDSDPAMTRIRQCPLFMCKCFAYGRRGAAGAAGGGGGRRGIPCLADPPPAVQSVRIRVSTLHQRPASPSQYTLPSLPRAPG